MQIGPSDKKVIAGNSSFSGPGPPSNLFKGVKGEAKVVPQSAGS